MPKFISERDFAFFKSIDKELVYDIVDTYILLFQLMIVQSETNIYGENINKTYKEAVKLHGIITRSGTEADEKDYGSDVKQTLDIGISLDTLKDAEILPVPGDIMFWNNNYYEIHNTNENQYIAGRPELSFSLILNGHLTELSHTNIGERLT